MEQTTRLKLEALMHFKDESYTQLFWKNIDMQNFASQVISYLFTFVMFNEHELEIYCFC